MNKNYRNLSWYNKISMLLNISTSLKEIHQKKMVHHDFHTGNILSNIAGATNSIFYISDMGLCGDVSNNDQNNIYGVMPYVAPEVLKGELYTQAADIYSFGMIMYFVATGRQPFFNCAHDELLVLNICSGIRPEINEPEAPKCYIDLMKQCWDSNPNNRPKAAEVFNLFMFLYLASDSNHALKVNMGFEKEQHFEIQKQIKEAEECRRSHPVSFDGSTTLAHPQAIYKSRLLNPFTKNILKFDNIDNNTVEITDFTK
ncbi:kinase-like domain-containing protein [Rhizophagus diaphanus]|nr:kinase-like domain-containing protein [Rhizophagus diaphanus] [Rhizophagus sp. MUCL 43196]